MSFLGELGHRRVFRVAAMYAVVAWLLIEVITTVEEPLNLPEWSDTFVIVLLAIGFPVSLILSWAFDVTPDGIKPAKKNENRSSHSYSSVQVLSYVTQVFILIAVLFLVVDEYVVDSRTSDSTSRAGADVIRYSYKFPNEERLLPSFGVSIAVSPDGSSIAYIGPGQNGSRLWIRERSQIQSTPLPDSDKALQPFFSPGGRGIGFITSGGQLKVILHAGEPARTIVDSEVNPFGGAWGDDEYLYFSTKSGLMRQLKTGGDLPDSVTHAEPEGSVVINHGWPDILPNGKGALFTIMRDHLQDEVAVVDFSTGEIHVLAKGSLGRYAASGHLVYVREDGGLMAVPFDLERLTTNGEEVLLGDQLTAGFGQDFALSKNGRMLYTKNNASWELVWVDRDGNWSPLDTENPIHHIRYVSLSPDDSKLAVTTWPNPSTDHSQLWIKELPKGPFYRLTFDGDVNMRPSWSLDGSSVIFISDRGKNRDAWMKRIDNVTEAEVLLDEAEVVDEALLSLDGDWLVFRRGKEDGNRDILGVRRDSVVPPTKLVASRFDEVAPALSADSRWLAYVSNRADQANVYVRPFPQSDSEYQVSVNGGTEPVWSRSGAQLYYRNGKGEMVVVPVLPGQSFEMGPKQILFSANEYRSDFYHSAFDVTTDEQRFVMIRKSVSGSLDEELIVVENWFEELMASVPIN